MKFRSISIGLVIALIMSVFNVSVFADESTTSLVNKIVIGGDDFTAQGLSSLSTAVKDADPTALGGYVYGINSIAKGENKFYTNDNVYDFGPYMQNGYFNFKIFVEAGTAGTVSGNFKLMLRSTYGVATFSDIPLSDITAGSWQEFSFKLSDLQLSKIKTLSSTGEEVAFYTKICGLSIKYDQTDAPNIKVKDISVSIPSNATMSTLIKNENGSLTLNWSCEDTSAAMYDVYKNGVVILNNTSDTTYTDNNPLKDAVNSYYVVSKDSTGNTISTGYECSQVIYDDEYVKKLQIYTNADKFTSGIKNKDKATGTIVRATSPTAGGLTVCGVETVSSGIQCTFSNTDVEYDLTNYINDSYVKIPMYVKPGASGKIDGTYKFCFEAKSGVACNSYTLSNIHEGWNFINIKLSDLTFSQVSSSGVYRYTRTVGINIAYTGDEAPSIYVCDIALWASVKTEINSVEETNGKLTISWDTAAADATKYDVYRNGRVVASDITEKTYTDNTPAINSLNKYKVAAKDANGDLIGISEEKGRAVYDNKYVKLYSVYDNAARSDLNVGKQINDKNSTEGISKKSSTSIIPGTSISLEGAYYGDKGIYRFQADDLKKDMTDFYNDGYLRFLIKVSPYDEENIGTLRVYLNSTKGNATNYYTVPVSEYNSWIPVEIKLSDMTPISTTEERIKLINGISMVFTGEKPNADIYLQDIGFWGINTPSVSVVKTNSGADVSWVSYNRNAAEYNIYKNGSELLSTASASFDDDNVFAPYKGTYSDASVISDSVNVYSVAVLDSSKNVLTQSNGDIGFVDYGSDQFKIIGSFKNNRFDSDYTNSNDSSDHNRFEATGNGANNNSAINLIGGTSLGFENITADSEMNVIDKLNSYGLDGLKENGKLKFLVYVKTNGAFDNCDLSVRLGDSAEWYNVSAISNCWTMVKADINDVYSNENVNSLSIKYNGSDTVSVYVQDIGIYIPNSFIKYSTRDILTALPHDNVISDIYLNNTDTAVTPAYVAASYNGNELDDIQLIDNVTIAPHSTYKYEITNLKVNENNTNQIIKTFMFNNMTDITPLMVSSPDDKAYARNSVLLYKKSSTADAKKTLRVNCLGDSITVGYGAVYTTGDDTTTKHPYHSFWAEDYDLNARNYGVSGSTVANYSGTNDSSFVERYSAMANDADVVTILGGVNDFYSQYAVGTINDTAKNTFYGAYKSMVEGLMTKYPDAQIVLFIPLNAPARELYREPRKNAIIEIGKLYNLPVIDLNTDEIAGSSYGFDIEKYSTDNLHPNAEGQKIIAKYMMDKMVQCGIISIVE